MKRVAILGCTGSIGTQTIEVIRHHPMQLQITALAANTEHPRVAALAHEFKPKYLAMYDPVAAERLSEALHRPVFSEMDGLIALCTAPEVDMVVVSVAGMIGLEPTIAAISAGKEIALASKEVLVAGGAIVMPLVKEKGANLIPIDSEHSAILQCLLGSVNVRQTSVPPAEHSGAEIGVRRAMQSSISAIEKLILTASGGPFRGWTLDQMKHVTAEQALNHPTWRMGGKITIDSATLMNKGLEIIEACWLYEVSPEQIEVVIHPQSVIHSMVKFRDGSVLAQIGHPDMKLPIQYALLGSHSLPSPARDWDPLQTPALTFETYDRSVFICPDLAREAFRRGGVAPAFLNAVNEEAVNAFLRAEIGFLDIQRLCERSLSVTPTESATLETVLQADAGARAWVRGHFLEATT